MVVEFSMFGFLNFQIRVQFMCLKYSEKNRATRPETEMNTQTIFQLCLWQKLKRQTIWNKINANIIKDVSSFSFFFKLHSIRYWTPVSLAVGNEMKCIQKHINFLFAVSILKHLKIRIKIWTGCVNKYKCMKLKMIAIVISLFFFWMRWCIFFHIHLTFKWNTIPRSLTICRQ